MAGLWNWITQNTGKLGENLARRDAGSSEDYKNAFSQAGQSIDKTQALADKYTGNAGYENTLAQAQKGAGLLANQAIGTAASGARNAGMSKAQAAQMASQMGNQAYANAFLGQQGTAQNLNQNAISAQQGVTSAQQGQAGMAQSEKGEVYKRAVQNDPIGRLAAAGKTAVGLSQ